MHLEQALAENTAALKALTAALASLPHPAPSAQPAPIAAPSTAAVIQPPIVPVEQTATSPEPTTAFAQPAATSPLPAVPAAPPIESPAASGERDAKGMPWDGRIHASTKAKVADGTWRYKRGVDDTVIKPIEAELRAAMAAPAPVGGSPAFAPHPFYEQPAPAAAVGVPAAPLAAPAIPAVPVVAAPATIPPAPVAAPAPAAPVAVPVAGASGVTTYETLMAALPSKIVTGELTATQLQQACETFGVPSIAALAARPDLVQSVASLLKI